jgi:hypothetical protein
LRHISGQTLRAKEARLRSLALSCGYLIKKLRDSEAALPRLGRYAVINIAVNGAIHVSSTIPRGRVVFRL